MHIYIYTHNWSMVRTNYPCASKNSSSHQSTLSTVRERKLNSCSATTVRLSSPKILSYTKAAGNYATKITKYLLVFSIGGPWMARGLFSKYAVLRMFKSQKTHCIMLKLITQKGLDHDAPHVYLAPFALY